MLERFKEGYKGIFGINDHESKRHHWDLRLEAPNGSLKEYKKKRTEESPEHPGTDTKTTLVSWALPKHHLPKDKEKLMLVLVEDHPVEYITKQKYPMEIPAGLYGAGRIELEDEGTYEVIMSSKESMIIKLNGKKHKGTYNIISTGGDKFLITEHKGDSKMEKKTSLKVNRIVDDSGKVLFIAANDYTRNTFINVYSKTVINETEWLDAIVGFQKSSDIEKGKAKVMKFNELKIGDEFSFASDTSMIYTLDYISEGTAYVTTKKGTKTTTDKLDIKKRADDKVFKIIADIAVKKKIKYFQQEPLKTMEDYPEFLKTINPRMQAELETMANGLYKEASGLWNSIKTIVDLISPFIGWFVKNPKLKQAYNLLVEVIREKQAIYGDNIITITAEEYLKKKYSHYNKDLFEELESYLLDKGRSFDSYTENDIKAIISCRKIKD